VIAFIGQNNVSIGDMFQRTTAYSNTYPRININRGTSIAFDGADRVQQGLYSRQTGVSGTLTNNTANQTILTFDATATRAVQINYTITRDVNTQTGVYTIVAGTDASGTGLQGSDSSTQNASVGVTFSVIEAASTVTWRASTTNTGIAATINYSVTRLA